MPKIKLTSKSYHKFTGMLGTVAFENGVSVESPSSSEANRLAALTSCDFINEEGNSEGQAGLGVGMAAGRSVGMPVRKASERGVAEPYAVEKNAPNVEIPGTDRRKRSEEEDLEQALNAASESTKDDEAPQASGIEDATSYSKAELEEIADAKGIQGLREIADPFGVKDNSIKGLIKEILNAQDNS